MTLMQEEGGCEALNVAREAGKMGRFAPRLGFVNLWEAQGLEPYNLLPLRPEIIQCSMSSQQDAELVDVA